MDGFTMALLTVVLVLVLLQFILGAAKLKEPANQIIWVVAIVVAVLWLFGFRFGR